MGLTGGRRRPGEGVRSALRGLGAEHLRQGKFSKKIIVKIEGFGMQKPAE